jgi:hypothetical protein
MTRFRTGVLTLATTAMLVAASPAGPATGPQWRPLPLPYRAGADLEVLGFAAGRVWIETGDKGFTLLSATVTGGKLGGFVKTTVAGVSPWLLDNRLVYIPAATTATGASMIAPLLPDGHVGPATPLPGDPEAGALRVIDPNGSAGGSAHDRAMTALTVQGRVVWALEGGITKSVNGGSANLVLCCTAAGDPVDLTSLLVSRQQGVFPGSLALGLDAKNRLWLAWTDSKHNVSVDPALTGHLVQLDPATLNGVSSNLTAPVFASSHLACAEICRLVFANELGVAAWRGTGVPGVILRGKAYLLGADVRNGRLELATQAGTTRKQRLVVRRGAPSGSGLKIASSLDIPTGLGNPNDLYHALALPAAAGTPKGFVAVQPYVDFRDRTRLYAAVLP